MTAKGTTHCGQDETHDMMYFGAIETKFDLIVSEAGRKES